jgi:hypothetical protein
LGVSVIAEEAGNDYHHYYDRYDPPLALLHNDLFLKKVIF